MLKIPLLACCVCCSQLLYAQIGLGITTPHPNAYFQINSTTKGVLLPRMTATQRIAIAPAPTANGLIVFDTDSTAYMFWTGNSWRKVGGDDSKWHLQGNYNTNPPSPLNSAAINFSSDTYLGTPDAKDVSLVAGGNELIRLKQFATGGRIGFSNRNPEYSLDIRTTEISTETQIQGMRLIAKPLFDVFSTSNADKGFVWGHHPSNVNEMAIWNHANNINGAIRFGLDAFNTSIVPAWSITGTGQGINQRNPLYFLDIHSQSQFAAANSNLLGKNGLRISYPDQGAANNMERGLFVGLATNANHRSYIWNYADGTGGNNPSKSILFGIGGDMVNNNRPTLLMQDGILSIGRIRSNSAYPSVINIQTDYAHAASKKGISVLLDNTSNTESAYVGLDEPGNLELSKFTSGDILFNAGNQNRMIIKEGGNVGIGTNTPVAKLHTTGTGVLFSSDFFNEFTSDNPPDDGLGTRFMWYPQKAAVRAGRLDFGCASCWDRDSIGAFSIAIGNNVKANGRAAVALGDAANARGFGAFAVGLSTASESYSLASGNSTALGFASVAMGQSTAIGTGSIAMGLCSSIGQNSFSAGSFSITIGNGAVSLGVRDSAIGNYSTALGRNSSARSEYSFASGFNSIATGSYSTAMGRSQTNGTYNFAAGFSFTSGNASAAVGGAQAYGNGAFAGGFGYAEGAGAAAVGSGVAAADYATAFGDQTNAYGYASLTAGEQTFARARGAVTLGMFNDLTESADPLVTNPSDRIFQLGNGSSLSAASNALTVLRNGNTGIGVLVPQAKLDVNGSVKIADGTQAAGKVLTSDAAGLASWQPLPSSTNYWSLNGANIYNNNAGNVGIGTNAPITPLSFQSAVGNKISLWGTDPNNHYGFGIQGFLMQMYCGGASDNIAFGYGSSSNFTERMRITGTGNVGIGTTSPAYTLHLGNSNSSFRIEGPAFSGSSGKALSIGGYGDVEVDRPGVVGGRFTIRENGNVGVGLNDPAFILDINGRMRIRSGGSNASSAGIWLNNNANTVSPGFMGMESDDAIGFFGNGTPNGWGLVMRIASGNVGIGTSAPAEKLHVMGNILAAGTITPSDIRYKKEVSQIVSPLSKLLRLQGVTYRMRRDAFPEWQFDSSLQYGLIAQETEKVFPEMVKQISADGYKGIDYVKLIPVLLEGLRELDEQNRALKQENETIRERLSRLEDKVNRLQP